VVSREWNGDSINQGEGEHCQEGTGSFITLSENREGLTLGQYLYLYLYLYLYPHLQFCFGPC
jgi:hypothetical protein